MSPTAGPGPEERPSAPATGAPSRATPPPHAADRGAVQPEAPLLDTERVARATPRPRFGRVPLAWTVAIAADAVQWVLWPVFLAGAATPADDIIDVVVAVVLVKLLGWHWAFAPSFVVKLIPVADFVPTWTMAVFIATRGRGKP